MITGRLFKSCSLMSGRHCSFSTTIALFSGGAQEDALTNKIAQGLKKTFKGVDFIGVPDPTSGDLFSKKYASSSDFDSNPIQIHKTYVEWVQDAPITVYRSKTHWKNHLVLNKIFKGDYLQDLQSKNVSAVINVGNFAFTRRLNLKTRQYYKDNRLIAPPVFFYDRMAFNRLVENEAFIDFQFYNIPRQANTYSNYKFPSMCIGYEGLFKAFRHLTKFSKNSDLTLQNFKANPFGQRVSELVKASRKEFRTANNIPEDNYVILLAPGNTTAKVDFMFKNAGQGVAKFFTDSTISSYGKDNFSVLVISTGNKKADDAITAKVRSMPGSVKPILVSEQDRYGALCAADYGIVTDGETSVEAAACQLPATVVNEMSIGHAYIANVLNVYESPLNISVERMGYHELHSASEAHPLKLSQLMIEHFKNPKLKFYYMDMYEKPLQQMIQMSGKNQNHSLKQTGLQASFKIIEAFVNKYKKVDVKSYTGHWMQRKDVLVPKELSL